MYFSKVIWFNVTSYLKILNHVRTTVHTILKFHYPQKWKKTVEN